MDIITTVASMRRWAHDQRVAGHSIGFVPTMGALHEGHGSLIRASAARDDCTVLSVFVNPTQFNEASDFDSYPRTLETDIEVAERNGVDVVFAPVVEEMYPDGATARVHPGPVAATLEGLHRPGHFDGVATVVLKLFNAVDPDRAYFGLKDFQQVAVVRSVVRDLDVPVDIVAVPTVRDVDGLALSSRNARLDPAQRRAATVIHRALRVALDEHRAGRRRTEDILGHVMTTLRSEPGCRVEYVDIVDSTTLRPISDTSEPCVVLVAAWFGDVRLIDNIELSD